MIQLGKEIRNLLAGMLAGYGFVSFFCFIFLEIMWSRSAPHQPNPARGLIYQHNEHGDYTYFSAFQATTGWLMFNTSIPLGFIGALIAPKKDIIGTARWYGARFNWDRDDPRGIMKWTAIISAAATPLIVFVVGAHVIRALNGAGFVMNLG